MQDTVDLYQTDDVKLHSRISPDRELTRYVFSLGDHIEPTDKKNLRAPLGGIWVGHSEVEGAPTMKRTRYMLHSCGITPLETVSIPKKADHREEKSSDENYLMGRSVPPGTRGYNIYPGDNLNYLQSDRFRPLGVVELPLIKGKEYNQGVEDLQLFFFPNWYNWLSGKNAFPIFISDRENIVKEAMERAGDEDYFTEMGKAMLESGRLFRQFASAHIERNRQMIQSMRNTNMGGFTVSWTEKTRLYARQLNLKLEDENELRETQKVASSDTTALLQHLKQDSEIRKRELEIQKQQNAILMAIVTGKFTGTEEIQKAMQSLQVTQQSEAPELKIEEAETPREERPEDKKFDPSLHDVSPGADIIQDKPSVNEDDLKIEISDNTKDTIIVEAGGSSETKVTTNKKATK